MQDWQLANNKIIFKDHYGKEKWVEHYFLISAHKDVVDMRKQCEIDGHQFFALEELTDYLAEDTGNAIFDEFWRRDWGE